MNKMLVAIFAVTTIAVSASAIQLNWAVPAGAMNDSANVVLANKTVALIMAASTATTAGQITYSYADGNWPIGGGTLVNVSTLNASGKFTANVVNLVGAGGTGAWGTDAYVGVDFLGKATTTISQGVGAPGAARYYMIVFDGTYDSGNYAVASPAANTTVASGISSATVSFSTGTGSGSTWTAVPEPTSMALLALGTAAIGLRRKFRK